MSLKQLINDNGRDYLTLCSPVTGQTLRDASGADVKVPVSVKTDVQEAVARARESFKFWGSLPHKQRCKFLMGVRAALAEKAERIARCVTRETGKPLAESMAEVYEVLEGLKYFARQTGRMARERWRLPTNIVNLAKPYRMLWHPKGVIAYISPWNYPFALPMMPSAQAIAAGNTVVLKPSSETPLVTLEYHKLFEGVWKTFSSAPCPLQIVVGPHRITGEAIFEELANGNIADLALTGSVQAGVDVNRRAAEWLKNPVLELGGKDPLLVCDDADLERAARAAVFAAFYNCGQTCCAVERVYVTRKNADRFIRLCADMVRALKVGDGADETVDMGPQINQAQLQITTEHIADAVGKGATIVCGGKRLIDGPFAAGNFIEPTILAGVNHSMLAMSDETFGPTLPIMVVESEAEMLDLANDTPFGLNASVWAKDTGKAYAIAERIVAGVVYVNDVLWSFTDPSIPWIGVKYSGKGGSQGTFGLHCSTRPQVLVVNPSRRWLPLDMGNPWMYPAGRPGSTALLRNSIIMQHGASGRLAASLASFRQVLGGLFGK
jgi:acyl-CoA reductase-like NAD-dependent aldehyde dehydrogenase